MDMRYLLFSSNSFLSVASLLIRFIDQDALERTLEQIQKLGRPSTKESLHSVASTSLNSKMLKPYSAFFVDLLQK